MILSSYPIIYLKCRTLHSRRYIDDIFVLLKSLVHLKRSQSYLIFCCVNMSLTVATVQSNKISFLDVNVISEKMVIQKTSLIEHFKFFLNRIHVLRKKRFLQLKRSLCDQSFLIQEIYHCKLGLNCKSPSKGYLTAVNCRLFSKVQKTL